MGAHGSLYQQTNVPGTHDGAYQSYSGSRNLWWQCQPLAVAILVYARGDTGMVT